MAVKKLRDSVKKELAAGAMNGKFVKLGLVNYRVSNALCEHLKVKNVVRKVGPQTDEAKKLCLEMIKREPKKEGSMSPPRDLKKKKKAKSGKKGKGAQPLPAVRRPKRKREEEEEEEEEEVDEDEDDDAAGPSSGASSSKKKKGKKAPASKKTLPTTTPVSKKTRAKAPRSSSKKQAQQRRASSRTSRPPATVYDEAVENEGVADSDWQTKQ
jgi:hypothetical protein